MTPATAKILESLSLTRNDSDWQGRILLTSWKGFQRCLGPYVDRTMSAPSDGEVRLYLHSEEPSPSGQPDPVFYSALREFLDDQDAIRDAMVERIVKYCLELRDRPAARFGPVPRFLGIEDLKKRIGPSALHVWAGVYESSPVFVGVEFGCDWDADHGLGVLTVGGRIVGIGQADAAFSEPYEIETRIRPAMAPEYLAFINDNQPNALEFATPVAPRTLGDLGPAYTPHLRDGGLRIVGLIGLEALILAHVLDAREVNAHIAKPLPYDLHYFLQVFPGATNLGDVMNIIAATRIAGVNGLMARRWHPDVEGDIGFANGALIMELEKVYRQSDVIWLR